MPRKKRKHSEMNIYHVMLRGINKQDIFMDDDDYLTMMRVIGDAHIKRTGPTGRIISENECKILSYCCMPNHCHLLIKEGEATVSQIMKRIEDRFVFFINRKYDRCGHYFQDRFRSEPVNDTGYLCNLFRYINRNPVKGMLCDKPEQYMYSSMREFTGDGSVAVVKVCDRDCVFSFMPQPNLIEWINTDVDDKCMDMDGDRFVRTEQHALAILMDISGAESAEDFKQIPPKHQIQYIMEAINSGVSMRQASHLSAISYAKIQYEVRKRNLDSYSKKDFNQGVRPLDRKSNKDSDMEIGSDRMSIEEFLELPPEDRVMELVSMDGKMSMKEMARRCELSVYGCRKVFQLLVRQHRIEKKGNTSDARWQVVCE